MAGRAGTEPFGAGRPVSGHDGFGAAVVVVVGGSGLSAALWGGLEEQALRINPAIPTEARAPQASGRRARVRCATWFFISATRSYVGCAQKWWHLQVCCRSVANRGRGCAVRASAGRA